MKRQILKALTVLLIISALAGGMAACGKKEKAQVSDGTFTVGFDAEFPPYGYKDESGEYVGFDLDLAQEVCNRNGWTLVKQPIDWDSKDMELNSGTISCIWNGFTMDGREDEYTWSSAYVDNSQVVVVRADSGITKLSDLAGKVVVVQADSSALAAFTGEDAEEANRALAASFQSLQQVSDYNSAFMNLESGSVDAVCMDIGVAKYELEARGGKYVMLNEHVSSEQYGIGFKKGNTELRNQVQEALNEMLADGTFNEIAQKWKLEESVCLGQSGADEVMLAENGQTQKKNSVAQLGDIIVQLKNGMFATLGIFILTLVFSLPLTLGIFTAADYIYPYEQNKAFTVDCEDLYFNYAWYAVDAAAFGCIFRTILPVWHFTVILVSFLCSYYWFCIKLCGIFCGNLPRRYRSCSGRTV